MCMHKKHAGEAPLHIFGEPTPPEQILDYLCENPELYYRYQEMPPYMQQQFLDFCCGVSGLCICYDPFFKYIFNAELHPERLSEFLTALIGVTVRVRRVLPNEGGRLVGEGSLVIMDIVVELEDHSLGNVEIQKYPYAFPGPRAACYSSDLVLRQYSSARSRGKGDFDYRELRTVYTIVILEKSGAEFHAFPNQYLHRSSQVFDTGLDLDLLQKYIYIPLDVFRKYLHNKDIETEQEAWLSFLAYDDPEHVFQIQDRFPRFRELYADMAGFRKNVKEVLGMFSEALAIMDRNTVRNMMEEQQKELEENKKKLAESRQELAKSRQEVEESRQELEESRQEVAENKKELAESKRALMEKDQELALLKAQLAKLSSQSV